MKMKITYVGNTVIMWDDKHRIEVELETFLRLFDGSPLASTVAHNILLDKLKDFLKGV